MSCLKGVLMRTNSAVNYFNEFCMEVIYHKTIMTLLLL